MKSHISLAIIFASILISCLPKSNAIYPTEASTQTAVPTFTPEILFRNKLSAIVLSPDEIPPLDPNYPIVFEPQVQDLTNQILDCNKDCVYTVWKSQPIEGVGERQVTLILIRTESDLQAAENANNSWMEFSQVESGAGFDEGSLIQSDFLPKNSKVGIKYKEPDVEVIFTASRGPVYMMFVYYFQASRDLKLDFGSIQHLAILQLKKLETAGYPK